MNSRLHVMFYNNNAPRLVCYTIKPAGHGNFQAMIYMLRLHQSMTISARSSSQQIAAGTTLVPYSQNSSNIIKSMLPGKGRNPKFFAYVSPPQYFDMFHVTHLPFEIIINTITLDTASKTNICLCNKKCTDIRGSL